MTDSLSTSQPKLRSRAYPVIPLQEAVSILRRQFEPGSSPRDREAIAKALGYASGASGIAARKTAALVHFGFLSSKSHLYSLTKLAEEILCPGDETRYRSILREAFLNPTVFRTIIHDYERVGRIPRQLALELTRDHGIQSRVADEVAHNFMTSAVYAGILTDDGSFRDEYFEETSKPRPKPVAALSHSAAPLEGHSEQRPAGPDQLIRLSLTDQKNAELRLPGQLNEHDIVLLRAWIDLLDVQVRLNRPDQPVRLDLYRSDRKK
jgi:hypothetical protein